MINRARAFLTQNTARPWDGKGQASSRNAKPEWLEHEEQGGPTRKTGQREDE